MKAYRIVNWKEIGEVTKKGKAATVDTEDDQLKKTKPSYARWRLRGHSIDPRYRRLAKKAYQVGKMMEAAITGLYVMLFDLAGDWDDPKLRGWILDDLKRPMDAYQIAELFLMPDKEHVAAAIEIMCDPEIGMLEEVEFDLVPPNSPEAGGNEGKAGNQTDTVSRQSPGDGGSEGNPFKNVTETEINNNLNLNVTETHASDTHAHPRPPTDRDTDSVSDFSVTDSDKDPSAGGGGHVFDIRKAKSIAVLRVTEILRPKDKSDFTTFSDIFNQLEHRMILETDLPLFDLALEKAAHCTRARNPPAVFVAAMKESPFNYIPIRRQIIRGKFDSRYRSKK